MNSSDNRSLFERIKNSFEGIEDDESFVQKVKLGTFAVIGVLAIAVFVGVYAVIQRIMM